MKVAWERLIRFVATDGRVLYGEPILPTPDFDIGDTTDKTKLQARVIEGDDLYDTTGATRVTNDIVTVKKLLGPMTPLDVPILRCVGLNYATHSESILRRRELIWTVNTLPILTFVAHSSRGWPEAATLPFHLL